MGIRELILKIKKTTLHKIKEEIDKIQSGVFDKIDNPLKNVPHTHVELSSNKWDLAYEREEEAYILRKF